MRQSVHLSPPSLASSSCGFPSRLQGGTHRERWAPAGVCRSCGSLPACKSLTPPSLLPEWRRTRHEQLSMHCMCMCVMCKDPTTVVSFMHSIIHNNILFTYLLQRMELNPLQEMCMGFSSILQIFSGIKFLFYSSVSNCVCV